jgi:hypothetical protein
MEAPRSAETSVNIYHTTWRHFPEDIRPVLTENRLRKRITSKLIFRKCGVTVGMDCTGSEQSPMAGFCEHDKASEIL